MDRSCFGFAHTHKARKRDGRRAMTMRPLVVIDQTQAHGYVSSPSGHVNARYRTESCAKVDHGHTVMSGAVR